MSRSLLIGNLLIEDLMNPRPEEIDIYAIEACLRNIRRFSNNPYALTVHHHRALVSLMAMEAGASEGVVRWCWHHDDHEGVIGDIVSPLESLLRDETDILDRLKLRLDETICTVRGIPTPTETVRRITHHFDKMAASIEWQMVLDQPEAAWNAPFLDMFDAETCRSLLLAAQQEE